MPAALPLDAPTLAVACRHPRPHLRALPRPPPIAVPHGHPHSGRPPPRRYPPPLGPAALVGCRPRPSPLRPNHGVSTDAAFPSVEIETPLVPVWSSGRAREEPFPLASVVVLSLTLHSMLIYLLSTEKNVPHFFWNFIFLFFLFLNIFWNPVLLSSPQLPAHACPQRDVPGTEAGCAADLGRPGGLGAVPGQQPLHAGAEAPDPSPWQGGHRFQKTCNATPCTHGLNRAVLPSFCGSHRDL